MDEQCKTQQPHYASLHTDRKDKKHKPPIRQQQALLTLTFQLESTQLLSGTYCYLRMVKTKDCFQAIAFKVFDRTIMGW